MAQGGERVEGRAAPGDRGGGPLPAEGLLVGSQPQLHRLGGDRAHPLDEGLPRRLLGHDLARHVRQHPERDREDHLVVVAARLQPHRSDVRPGAAVRLERLARDRRRSVDLVELHVVGEHREPLDPHQRPVLVEARAERDLSTEADGLDALTVGARVEAIEAMEELEAHAPPSKGLVQGREHHIAHPCSHLPEHRSPVGKEHAAGEEEPGARADGGSGEVAVLVGEGEVVGATHEG